MRALAFIIVLAGCRFEPGMLGGDGDAAIANDDGGGSGDDGGGSGDGGGSDACTMHVLPPAVNVDPATWSASFLTAPVWNCNGGGGTTTIDSTAGTATSSNCSLGTPELTNGVTQLTGSASSVLVVRLRGLAVTNGHTLRLTGDKPIVLLVAGDVLVDNGGVIDAGARANSPGPGGSPASCVDRANGRGMPFNSSDGWGGGGGGFGAAGGQGGYDTVNGGMAIGDPSLVPLRGGCQGGVGGGQLTGAGGGAFEISASGTITIGNAGNANLSAAGGGAPAGAHGGNGGGAGGGILLVAPSAAVFGGSGAARAHGGSGSAGCSTCASGNEAGGDGHITDNSVATDTSGSAGGGNGNDQGRAGGLAHKVGTGNVTITAGAMTTAQSGGRGGGGGGGGRIAIATGTTTEACD